MESETDASEYAYSSEEEMDYDYDNPNAAPVGFRAPALGVKHNIRMVPASQMHSDMNDKLRDTSEILDLDLNLTDVLLRQYKYSQEALLEAYTQDPDKCLQKAGVYHRIHPISALTDNIECPICYDDVQKAMPMPCGHAFCENCWTDFLVNAVKEGPTVIHKLTCPQAGCPERVLDEIKHIQQSHPDIYAKYETYKVRAFVEANPLTRWCPGAGCEQIACATNTAAMEAEQNLARCGACSTHFCMVCGHSESHAPCSCHDLQLWEEKCRNESETANWILANTKCCPKCNSRIEKNQGCNHMTCQRCTFEFCWICMGDWKEHGANTGGYYKCNKFDSGSGDIEGDGGDQSDAAKAKRDLDRYLHYYKRYHAHKEAEAFAKKQLLETESRMVKLQEAKDFKWADVEFLKTANEQLVECRRVLKYTYVFAYYLDPANRKQRERFEHHQEMLERFTEHLSHLTEQPLKEMDRQDVVNQTRVVSQFLKNILAYVVDGMEE